MATKVFSKLLLNIGEALDDFLDGFLLKRERSAQKPANQNANTENLDPKTVENASEASEAEANNAVADTDDDVIYVTERVEVKRIKQVYMAGKEVRGPFSEAILRARAGITASASTSSGDYTEGDSRREDRKEDRKEKQDELRELHLLTGEEKEQEKEKSEEIGRDRSLEKNPQKQEAIIQARVRTKKFMEGLDKVTAQRIEAEIAQSGFVMQEMLKQELKDRGLTSDSPQRQFQQKIAAGLG